MRSPLSKLALSAIIALALALTLSCSDDSGGSTKNYPQSYKYCIKDNICLEGPFTVNNCLDGQLSNSCPDGSSQSVGGSSSSRDNVGSSSSRGNIGSSSSSEGNSDITYQYGFVVSGDAKGNGAEICLIKVRDDDNETSMELCGTEVTEYIEFYIINRSGSEKYPLMATNSNCVNNTNELICYGGINLVNGTVKVETSNITGLTGMWNLYVKVIDGKIPGDPIDHEKVAVIMTIEPD
jgi:hypothetical protein